MSVSQMYTGIEFNADSGVMAHQGAQYPYYTSHATSKFFYNFLKLFLIFKFLHFQLFLIFILT